MKQLVILGVLGFLSELSFGLFGIESRKVSQNLYISNAYHDAGSWGIIELCAEGSFATSIEVKYNAPSNLDETAVNGVRLYCTDYSTGFSTGYITSGVGPYGDWYGMQICSNGGLVTGFRANVLEYQGTFTDDVAVENIEVDCNYGAEIVPGLPIPVPYYKGTLEPFKFKEGEWSNFAICSDSSAVCGLQTRLDDGVFDDETSVADVVLFCCDTNSIMRN